MTTPNYLGMSDEDFMNQPLPENVEKGPEVEPNQEDDPNGEGEPNGTTTNENGGEDEPNGEADPGTVTGKDDPDGEGDGGGGEPDPEREADPDASPAGEPGAKGEGEQDKAKIEGEGKEKPTTEEPAKTEEVDYKGVYDQLFNTPIKANGKEFKIKSVEDAIRLAQMGANYNKNMAALKPVRQIAKSLEQNGLLDQEKIDFLIDLHLKKPEAIAKLVSDSKIDPLDLSADKASNYKPTSHGISDKQFALDETLDDLRSTPTYSKTLELVSNKWDAASQNEVANKPELFRYLNAHMENGIADLIQEELDRQEVLGGLAGLTSFQKYTKIGDQLHAAGKFAHIGAQAPKTNTPAPGTVIEPKKGEPKKEDDKLIKQRRAAAPTNGSSTKGKSGINPLALSDEEFEKMSREDFV